PPRRAPRLLVRRGRDAPGEDVGQLLDVGARDHQLPALVLLAEPVDELSAEDVDLPVQDPAPVGDLHLLVGELFDQILQLLVAQRAEIGKRVHSVRTPRPQLWLSLTSRVYPRIP